ncbi:hypothetical protein LCGC14_1674410 [marine sediment metagenome]|uniref:site-specific DNA-methyltransferase (cytosine-N(4)-specific) n=1 Tax=marine sediment metagenome TaxID=412755 RepID=A0A0F9HR81_9ZZZZ
MLNNSTIHIGDCRDVMRTMEAGSVQCVVTSPPYFGLRDYGTAVWEGGDAGCECDAGEPVPCTVCDIFSGAGTSGVVAVKHGRRYIGIELNPDYAAMSEKRISAKLDESALFRQ